MHIKQERKCVACRECKQQHDMLRIARINQEFLIDENNQLGVRGAYICKDKKCIDLTIKKKLLNRAFKTNICSSIYEKIGDYEQNY
ncbi:MAG: YlxR family protein [Clostridia bacterium]|nr:YlxR family protein [Clostridia bacterium]